MLYAQVRDGQIVRTGPAPTMPGYEEGRWWNFADPAIVTAYLAEYEWQPVTETARPADTASTYQRMSAELVTGKPTLVWTSTAKSPETIKAEASLANSTVLRDKAQQALALNATYLALVAPTNAQNVAQVQRLTRECSALIRLAINALDTTDGT